MSKISVSYSWMIDSIRWSSVWCFRYCNLSNYDNQPTSFRWFVCVCLTARCSSCRRPRRWPRLRPKGRERGVCSTFACSWTSGRVGERDHPFLVTRPQHRMSACFVLYDLWHATIDDVLLPNPCLSWYCSVPRCCLKRYSDNDYLPHFHVPNLWTCQSVFM